MTYTQGTRLLSIGKALFVVVIALGLAPQWCSVLGNLQASGYRESASTGVFMPGLICFGHSEVDDEI